MKADRPLIIVGAGMQAEEALYYFGTLGGRRIEAFVVDPEYLCESVFVGRPVLDFAEALDRFAPTTHDMFIAIGMTAMPARQRWYEAAHRAGYALPSFIHPTATVALNVAVGANTILKEMVVVGPYVRLGDDLIVYQHSSFSHHSSVGSHSFCAPAVAVSGAAEIGKRCFLGTGAIVRDRVRIGDDCIIGAGAVVMKDCQPGGIYRAAGAARSSEAKG